MKIQEQPAANNLAGILEQFANLPSSFPNYVQQMTALAPPLTEEEQRKYQQAKQWCWHGKELLKDGNYQQALESFSNAKENIPASWQDGYLAVWAEMQSADCYQHLGEFLIAVSKLEKTIEKASDRTKCDYALENCYKDLIKILGHLDSLEDTPKQPKNLLEIYEKEQINIRIFGNIIS